MTGTKNESALMLIKIVNNKGSIHDSKMIPKPPNEVNC